MNASASTSPRSQLSTQTGLCAGNFVRVASNGFGDPVNAYPHSMLWFNEHLYVGTTRACLAHRGRRRAETDPQLLGAIWPVPIPRELFEIDLRSQVWRYHPPSDAWTRVFTSPTVSHEGMEVPLSIASRAMASFQSRHESAPALYLPTMGSRYTPQAVMLRSQDGVQFDVLSEPGMGIPDPYKPRGVRTLVSFKSWLFTSPVVGQQEGESNDAGFMIVAATKNPAAGSWEIVCEPHFGDAGNLTVFDMAPWNGYLYAGTFNPYEGFQIWKTDAEDRPPFVWRRVISHGAYRGRLNQIALTLCPFGEHLYVGTGIQEGGWDRTNEVGPGAPELIRINPDDSWDLVVGEPRMTPDGLKVPLSGLGAGFNKPFAGYIWSIREHDGWLYVGTLDWMVHLQYSDVRRWPDSLRESLPPRMLQQLLEDYAGFDLWRTRDGYRWVPVTENGFNNCFNFGVRTMESTPHGLFVGAANPFGPESAVHRLAGWQYESNHRAGLEVWLGSRQHERPLRRPGPGRDAAGLTGRLAPYRTRDDIDALLAEFLEGSDFRHFGYWEGGTSDVKAACENLLHELRAFMPGGDARVVEIACGTAETTAYFARDRGPGRLTAITSSRADLPLCRARLPGVEFFYGELPELPLPGESYDCVIWVKGWKEWDTSPHLLRESFRVLKPGGKLVCFEVLPEGRRRRGSMRRTRPEAPIATVDEMQRILVGIGFRDVLFKDVTAGCLEGFGAFRASFMSRRSESESYDDETLGEAEDYLLALEDKARHCAFVTATRPPNGDAEP